jgi:hypothetical protein
MGHIAVGKSRKMVLPRRIELRTSALPSLFWIIACRRHLS